MLIYYVYDDEQTRKHKANYEVYRQYYNADNTHNSKYKDVSLTNNINLKDSAFSYSLEEFDEASCTRQINNAN
jgi:hypothetical protein